MSKVNPEFMKYLNFMPKPTRPLIESKVNPEVMDSYGNIKEYIDTEKVQWTCPNGLLTMTVRPRVRGQSDELGLVPYIKTCTAHSLEELTHQIDELNRGTFGLVDLYNADHASDHSQVVLCFLKVCGLVEPARPRTNRAVDSAIHLSAMSYYHSLLEEWRRD